MEFWERPSELAGGCSTPTDRAHFYVWAWKLGTLYVDTNYAPWKDYHVRGKWAEDLWWQLKLDHGVKEAMRASGPLREADGPPPTPVSPVRRGWHQSVRRIGGGREGRRNRAEHLAEKGALGRGRNSCWHTKRLPFWDAHGH